MKRELLLVSVVALLLAPPLVVSQSVIITTRVPIGLGFNPLTIESVGTGTPIYTAGDSVWVESYSSDVLTVVANSPHGAVALFDYLQPNGLDEMHTFNSSDPEGNWTVSVFDESTGLLGSTSFLLVNSTQATFPMLVGENLSGSVLNLDYTLPPTGAYNIQACTVGTDNGATSIFNLPVSLGGTFEVSLNGTTLTENTPGLKVSASVWNELYADRTYKNGTNLLSEEALAAQTDVVAASGAQIKEQLAAELNLRAGRYDLRSYIRTASGLFLFEASYLRADDGQWVSLQDCTELPGVNSGSFVMKSDLAKSPSTWPRSILLMYTADGIDGSTSSGVAAQAARVDLLPYSRGRASGVGATVTGAGLKSWSTVNGSAYLLGEEFPLRAQFEVQYEGMASGSFNLTIGAPYSAYPLNAPDGELVLGTTLNGAPVSNATIDLLGRGNTPVPFQTDGVGNLSLILPPGDYNLTATYGGHSAFEPVEVFANSTSSALLDFGTSAASPVLILLGAVGVAVGGVNVLVWTGYVRKRRLALPGPSK